ncbi:MAG: sigma 54-interacting transcriptional regulator [Nannocystaceae bacterium]
MRRWPRSSARCRRSRAPTRPCCSSARAAPARRSPRAPSIAGAGRRDGPFIAINCAALADTLLERALRPREGGVHGAASRRRGRLELADRGTFFLDEVGELKPGLQAKLLRVIQERRFERVGGNQTISVDIRWIAATNRDLEAMIAAGQFREDLYHRLAVFPVRLPPLRERAADLLPLAETLLARISEQLGRAGLSLTDDARQLLQGAPLPGNVRELANALERAAILSDDGVLRAEHFSIGEPSTSRDRGVPTMAEVERDAIRMALDLYDGNRRKAAEHLGIGLRTLYDKLKRFGLS